MLNGFPVKFGYMMFTQCFITTEKCSFGRILLDPEMLVHH